MVAVEGRLGEEGVCKGGGSESRQPRAPGMKRRGGMVCVYTVVMLTRLSSAMLGTCRP